jgi:cold shock CspA family protein
MARPTTPGAGRLSVADELRLADEDIAAANALDAEGKHHLSYPIHARTVERLLRVAQMDGRPELRLQAERALARAEDVKRLRDDKARPDPALVTALREELALEMGGRQSAETEVARLRRVVEEERRRLASAEAEIARLRQRLAEAPHHGHAHAHAPGGPAHNTAGLRSAGAHTQAAGRAKPMDPDAPPPAYKDLHLGELASFKDDKRYGFIKPAAGQQGGRDSIFFHISNWVGPPAGTVKGAVVSYHRAPSRDGQGWQALGVQLVVE